MKQRNKNHLAWILDGYFPINPKSSSIYDPKEVAAWIQGKYKDLSDKNIEGTGETAMGSVLIRLCCALGYKLPPTIILNSAEEVANTDMVITLEDVKYNGQIIVSQKPDIVSVKEGLRGLQILFSILVILPLIIIMKLEHGIRDDHSPRFSDCFVGFLRSRKPAFFYQMFKKREKAKIKLQSIFIYVRL